MEPFYSGSGQHRIFLSYHPPDRGDGQALTVVCAPLFAEGMRTHRALRDLSNRMSSRGHHVLRFDYRGTGDSFGALSEITLSDWAADLSHAVQEGRELSGVRSVHLLAVRAAALIVASAATTIAPIKKLVLWDPALDGRTYLHSLRHVRRGVLERNKYMTQADRQSASAEYGGHVLSPQLLQDLEGTESCDVGSISAGSIHVVHTTAACTALPENVSQHLVPFSCDWETDSEDLMNPQPVLEQLEKCLTKI